MGDSADLLKVRLMDAYAEAEQHLLRLEDALDYLSQKQSFPLSVDDFETLIQDRIGLAFVDQVIYRFSKVQDTMGAKLLKAFVVYQGESSARPFRDILNDLEKQGILSVDIWFALRELRNIIAHDYSRGNETALFLVNHIAERIPDVTNILLQLKTAAGFS